MLRPSNQFLRYVVNGLVATLVHYVILTINIQWLGFSSAGLANFVAAIVGISVSFLGSRYFVFQNTQGAMSTQALTFAGLYGVIAVINGLVLFVWTDWLSFDYRLGFVVSTVIQFSLSYFGNKRLVFTA